MVADIYYDELIPTGALRLVRKWFRFELQEEVAVYRQQWNPYAKRATEPYCCRWRKMRIGQVVWQISARTVASKSEGQ